MLYLYEEQTQESNGKSLRRNQSSLAYRMLALALKREYGIEELPRIETGIHGKPWMPDVPDIHFNISHCKEGILCGVNGTELGVDIESIRIFQERLAKRISHENEWKLIECSAQKAEMLCRIWVAKESYLKYKGTGINQDLRKIDLSGCKDDFFEKDGLRFHLWQNEKYCMSVCSEVLIEEFYVVKASDI